MKLAGTTFQAVLQSAQAFGPIPGSGVQPPLTAHVANFSSGADQADPGATDANPAGFPFCGSSQFSTRAACDAAAVVKSGSALKSSDGNGSSGTIRPASGHRDSSHSIHPNSNDQTPRETAPEHPGPDGNRPLDRKNQHTNGEGTGVRAEQNAPDQESTIAFQPSVASAYLPNQSLNLQNQAQPAAENPDEHTGRASLESGAFPSTPKAVLDAPFASPSSKGNVGSESVAQATLTMRSSASVLTKGGFATLEDRSGGLESSFQNSTDRSSPDHAAQPQRPLAASVPGADRSDPGSPRESAPANVSSSPTDPPAISDSVRQAPNASSVQGGNQPEEAAKSSERFSQEHSRAVKSSSSFGGSIREASSAPGSNLLNAGNPEIENHAGVPPKQTQVNGPQVSTTSTEAANTRNERPFKFENESAFDQRAPASVGHPYEPLPQLPDSSDLPLSGNLSESMKAGSPKVGKSSTTGNSLTATAAIPMGLSPADPASTIEANFRMSDSLHTHAFSLPTSSLESSRGSAGDSVTPHQAFEALDRTGNGPVANWVHTSSQRAEAGFQDPALGWIAVRADQNAAGVHATVLPATTEAAQSLGSQMAGLTAHLSEAHASIASLSLGTGEGREAGTAAGQSFHQGADKNREHQDTGDSQASGTLDTAVSSSRGPLAASPPMALAAEGRHISVMA